LPAVRAALRSPSFEQALAACISLTIFAFACGSSSVPEVVRVGTKLRWAMLVVLLVVAAGAARRMLPRTPSRSVLAAAWLLLLAVGSTAWSVDPRLTFERAGAFALLVVAAGLAAAACARRPERALLAVLGGAALVAVAGLVLLAVDRRWALQQGSTGVPTRFRGIGLDANTSSLLFGIALPLAIYAFLRARTAPGRAAAAGVFLLLDGSIVASGSRAPLGAGFVAALLVALLSPPRRLVTAAAVLVLLGASVGIDTIPKPLSTNPPAPVSSSQPTPKPGYYNAEQVFPLESDLGRPLPGHGIPEKPRSLTGSSGRTEAWRGALHQVALRPVAGHGFGTEDRVFVNRYYFFAGGVPENSYIGLLLELGVVGLLSFLAAFALWYLDGIRAWLAARGDTRLALTGAGAGLASGLIMAVVQSYFYSAGDIATLSLWLCGLVLVAVASQVRRA
jgi:O-Antigen ligase